jgi:hypothetical protein
MSNNTSNLPHFTSLQEIAREVGVDPQTISRRQSDFFPLVRLGTKTFASTRVYRSWLSSRLEAAGEFARHGDRAA